MSGLSTPANPIPATPPLHGLVASAQEVNEPDRWDSGFTITPENCVDIDTIPNDCWAWPEGIPPERPDPDSPQDSYDVRPFTLQTSFRCNAKGFQTIDYRGRARRQLEAATSKGLEFELWTGDQRPDNPHLASASATVIGGGDPFPARQALTLLGQALSNCAHGGRGMIHAPTFIVDTWLTDGGGGPIKEQGPKLVTVNRGDTIVSGTGYTGTGPGGIDPGPNQSWVYATGPVQFRLGETIVIPDTLGEAMDRRRNLIEYAAERDAAVNFDPCCHFAILIQIGQEIGS